MSATAVSPNGGGPGEVPPALPEDDLFEEIEQQLVPRLTEALGLLDRQRDQLIEAHRQQLGAVEERRRRYQRLLKGLGVEAPGRQSSTSGPKRRGGPSPRVLFGVIDTILAQDTETFSVLDIHTQLARRNPDWSWGEPQTYVAVSHLRGVEFLRKVVDTQSGAPALYKIWTREIGVGIMEKAKVTLEEKTARKRGSPPGTAPARMTRILTALHNLAEERGRSVTAMEVSEVVGHNVRWVREILNQLNEAGEVALGEPRRVNQNFGQPSRTYMPATMAEELTYA